MLGPPTIGYMCYAAWQSGCESMARSVGRATAGSITANVASAVSVVGAFMLQRSLLVRPLFDEGGSLALNWKKGTDTLGEPLKIKTWTQFYRAAGPPVFARTAAIVVAFYAAGNVHALVAARINPPPPPPPPVAKPAKANKGSKTTKASQRQ